MAGSPPDRAAGRGGRRRTGRAPAARSRASRIPRRRSRAGSAPGCRSRRPSSGRRRRRRDGRDSCRICEALLRRWRGVLRFFMSAMKPTPQASFSFARIVEALAAGQAGSRAMGRCLERLPARRDLGRSHVSPRLAHEAPLVSDPGSLPVPHIRSDIMAAIARLWSVGETDPRARRSSSLWRLGCLSSGARTSRASPGWSAAMRPFRPRFAGGFVVSRFVRVQRSIKQIPRAKSARARMGQHRCPNRASNCQNSGMRTRAVLRKCFPTKFSSGGDALQQTDASRPWRKTAPIGQCP